MKTNCENITHQLLKTAVPVFSKQNGYFIYKMLVVMVSAMLLNDNSIYHVTGKEILLISILY